MEIKNYFINGGGANKRLGAGFIIAKENIDSNQLEKECAEISRKYKQIFVINIQAQPDIASMEKK